MSPDAMRWAPNHMTATVERLKMSMTIGKTSAMSRPTCRPASVSRSLASAKRDSSWSSRTNARTTRMPVICSRMTRLTPSSEVCMRPNHGTMREMTRPTTRPSSGTATATSHESPTSSRSAMMMPPTIMIGVVTSSAKPMKTTICTWVTSLVLREMSVGAPKRVTSCAENSTTLPKTRPRTSRPIAMATRAARKVPATAAAICTRLTPSMRAPWLRMKPVSPLATPSSMISPLRLGR